MRILVTGGAGYIGSHTVLELLQAGHDVVVVDSLVNATEESLTRVARLAGRREPVPFHKADLRDADALEQAFAGQGIDAVVHFAGLKAVGESVAQPLRYYDNNVGATTSLLHAMERHDVRRLAFSSSATVYGVGDQVPFREDSPTGAINPYGSTKFQIERILTDVAAADDRWRIALLRYFNPVGAHPSGEIGEDPSGVPNNLMPFVAQVAVGRREKLRVFGADYPTPDGTGIRDYLHVVDLARGHVAALDHLDAFPGATPWNLGKGTGNSVLEVLHAFERAVGHELPHEIVPRRPGDNAVSYADASAARRDLGWVAEKDLNDMCADTWRWQSQNPNGYAAP